VTRGMATPSSRARVAAIERTRDPASGNPEGDDARGRRG
jgi:hypothetical protein